ncbi:hypothetical protein TEA_017779 [Camellia sinensis var. sinensis]|uniref:mevalonate kinase n=1 Tax=Camellia sinensis var. sinensis TaxID=542762 RepID=A0A4S4D8G6_CAMSN|nr:hypothetical protein TEA_017779 [Camellia sinensis var. sinensis]
MEVRTRAPGKIILAGEHAVVHGSTAVAASIDLYTYASLSFPTHSDNDDKLKLHLKDMALEFAWPVGRIKEALYKLGSQIPSSPASCSPEAMKLIAALVEEQNILEANTTLAAGVSAFLWLYISIQGYKPAKVVITSELPLGSGLGSSAAFCVSVSAALLALSESVNLDFGHQGWLMFGENELELVNKWAFEGEKIIHGKPSGIDNTLDRDHKSLTLNPSTVASLNRRRRFLAVAASQPSLSLSSLQQSPSPTPLTQSPSPTPLTPSPHSVCFSIAIDSRLSPSLVLSGSANRSHLVVRWADSIDSL